MTGTAPPTPRRTLRGASRRALRGTGVPAPAAAVLDVAAVLAFVLVGRRSHAEGLDLAGTLGTAWPFLAGLATGWVAARGWRAPSSRRTGAAVWAAAVAVGVLLRATTGDGAPVSFVVVTAFVLAALLLGWRVVAALVGCSGRR